LALAVRFILTIMLVVGGLSLSQPVSASVLPPHSDSMSAHHHVAASRSDRTSRDNAAHCLTLANVGCAVVQPTGISPVATIVQPKVLVWDVTPADSFFGQWAKVATPHPRI
jgi:hypothetical protein